jgi:hypothetical protein
MEGPPRGAQAGDVPRVIITGDQPQHLSREESEAWLRSQLLNLRTLPGVESIVLTEVSSSRQYPRACAWVCELHVTDAQACAAHPLCTEWLMDLRLLGMSPRLAILEHGERVV